MSVSIQEKAASAQGRITGIRLTMHTLRMMEKWRRNVSDYDSIMILIAVVAITAEKLTRCDLDPALKDLSHPIAPDQLAPCNISSIAAATGLNRETTRRKISALIHQNYLVRSQDGVISFARGHLQQDYIRELVREQLDALVKTTNELCRDGILTCDARGCRTSVDAPVERAPAA